MTPASKTRHPKWPWAEARKNFYEKKLIQGGEEGTCQEEREAKKAAKNKGKESSDDDRVWKM